MKLPDIALARGARFVALCAVAAGLLNALASLANAALSGPLFFDSAFTAAAAALFGPLAGLGAALSTHFFIEAFRGFDGWAFPFAACSMATGLIVGLFARAGKLRDLFGAMSCVILVAVANAAIGALVFLAAFHGSAAHASDNIVTALLLAGLPPLAASFWARIPANLVDKGVAVLFACWLSRLLRASPRP